MGREAAGAGRQKAAAACGFLIIVALWVLTRPYEGYVHDAPLYLVQALYRLDPVGFGKDLFFAYGSQEGYSVAARLYAPLVEYAGVARAHLGVLLLGQGLWLVGLWLLVRALCGRGWMALVSAIAAVALLPVYSYGALQYGENGATPRIFVEAAALAAIAAVLRGRTVWALLAFCVALPLHPIMTLPPLALVALLRFPLRWLFVTGGAGLAAVLALGFAGIDPFARAMATMDSAWFAIVEQRTGAAIVSKGFALDFAGWVLPGLVLALVAWRGEGGQRQLARAVLLLSPILVAASWVGADLFGNLLVMNLQLWRGMWLWVLVGNCLVPVAYLLLPKGGKTRVLFVCALLANLVEARVGIGVVPLASITLACASALVWTGAAGPRRLQSAARILGAALVLVGGALFLGELGAILTQPSTARLVNFLARAGLVLGCAALGLGLVAGRIEARLPASVLALLLAVSAFAIADQRTPRMAFLTSERPLDPAFESALVGKTVYWEGGLEFLWLRLRQPSYYSCDQVAGAMFFRGTAMEHTRRAAILRQLNTSDFGITDREFCPQRQDPRYEGPTSRAQLEAVCRDIPELDIMVLRANLKDVPHLRWQPGYDIRASGILVPPKDFDPRYVKGKPSGSYNLYRCSDLR